MSERTMTPYAAANLLGHSGAGRVKTLQREGKLPTPLTVSAVIEYRDSRGKKGAKDGEKLYHIRCDASTARAISEQFDVVVTTPYEEQQAREKVAMREAQDELAALLEELE